ncbi:MAG: class I SAM-dependent rRNA methyltransferase [Planctomycetes bacterium]|nr:class I SAM-dependent rRNA methyltransferase [Planctomycetota bacterium]
MLTKVLLKPRRAKPFWMGAPWVFDQSIERVKGTRNLADGDLVELRDHEGKKVGEGFYNSRSRISLRLIAWGEEVFDEALLVTRLRQAVALRREGLRLEEAGTTVYRLVHAEGDRLPGLVVDRVGGHLVMQIDCLGMTRFRDLIVSTLLEATGAEGLYERVSKMAREEEGIEAEEGLRAGAAAGGLLEVSECGLRFLVDVEQGQKTGFYADQRENRVFLAGLARGRRVLDAFSYTGAFGIHAGRAGAASVTAIDSSKPALENAERNVALNGITGWEGIAGNVLRVLDHQQKEGPRYDLVVLDPPKLVPRRSAHAKGLKLYREINAKGMGVLESGGILATCSCSGGVSEDDLREVVHEAARERSREIQEIWRGGQGPDHPAVPAHPDSRYLKFLVYRVI